MNDGFHWNVRTDEERSGPFGTSEFVGGEGRQVDPPIVNIDRDLAQRLDGIGVNERVRIDFLDCADYLGQRLDGGFGWRY
jgi:hypothetical protein